MSRMIQHTKSESGKVKATLKVHYSNLLLCSGHRQAMKALTWQRKQLNEAVHIFHSSVWKGCKFTAQTPETALLTHFTLRLLTFILLDRRVIWSFLTCGRLSVISVVQLLPAGSDVRLPLLILQYFS